MELVGIDDKLKLRTGHGAFELGKWSHIALVVDCSKGKDDYNEKYKLYVNGKQVKWDDSRKTDMDYSEIDLSASGHGGAGSLRTTDAFLMVLYSKHVSGRFVVQRNNLRLMHGSFMNKIPKGY